MNEPSKQHKIELIDYAFELDDTARSTFLVSMAEDYFGHYGIDMPEVCWDNGLLTPLIYPETKTSVKQAFAKIKQFAREWHNDHTPVIELENEVTRATIYKLIKKTHFGTRIQEMGKGGKTTDNLAQGFVTLPVMMLIIKLFETARFQGGLKHHFSDKARQAIPNYLKALV